MRRSNGMQAAMACAASLMLASCVTAPRQTIELADVVAEQAAALEKSHRQMVDAYFLELERRIDDFVDNQWTPDFLARAAASDQVRSSLESVLAGIAVDPNELGSVLAQSRQFSQVETAVIVKALRDSQVDQHSQFGTVMLDFSKAALLQINERRRRLKAPLEDHRRALLIEIDGGYADLRAGQSMLRAYLASVVELVEEQDLLLQKLNVLKARNSAMDAAVSASEAASDSVGKLMKFEGRFKDPVGEQ